jgi:hypothetical protein
MKKVLKIRRKRKRFDSRHDIQNNDAQNNGIQQNDTQNNDIQNNDTQNIDTTIMTLCITINKMRHSA